MGLIFRQTAKGTIVTLVGALVGFVTTFLIATTFLTPAEIGLTRVLVEAATIVGTFALLATHSSAIRYFPHFASPDGRDQGFLWWLLLIPLAGFLLFGGLYLLLRTPLTAYFAASEPQPEHSLFARYYLWVLPLMLFIMYQTILEVYCSIKERVAIPKLIREVVLRLLLLTAYLLYGLSKMSFDHFVVLFAAAYGVSLLFLVLYTLRLNPHGLSSAPHLPSPTVQKDFLTYTLLTVLATLGGSIVTKLDLFMVSSQMGFDYGGIYTIAFFMIALIEMPSRSLMSISSPIASDALHKGNTAKANQLYNRVSQMQVMIAMWLFLLIWINIDTIFWLIPNGEVYAQGKWVVFVLGIAKLVDLSFNFGNALLRYSRFFYWTFAYTLIVLTMTILLNLFLIERLGMVGAAIATLLTYLVSYSFQQWILWSRLRVTPVSIELGKLFLVLLGALLLDLLTPHIGHPLLDSLLRTLAICTPAWLLYRSTATYQLFANEVRSLIHKQKIQSDGDPKSRK